MNVLRLSTTILALGLTAGACAPLQPFAGLRGVPEGTIPCPEVGVPPRSALMRPDIDNPPLTVRGHQFRVPRGAVRDTVTIQLSVPPSAYLQVQVYAVGRDSFTFESPAELTLNYNGCPGQIPDSLVVLRIRGNTVENLGGRHDRGRQTVTADVPRLSDFVLAAPN